MTSSFWAVAAFAWIFASTAIANNQHEDRETLFYKELVAAHEDADVSKSRMDNIVFNGLSYKPIRPSCDPRRLEENLIKASSPQDYQKIAQIYFSSCSGDLTDGADTGLKGLLKFVLVKYDLFENPNIQSIKIPLGGNKYIPSIMAVKNDKRARPMVVIKCGVFCAAEASGSTRNYIMNLFDQSPFNVVLLANQTGLDYIQANQDLSLGGWSEGYEAHLVGRWLKYTWEKRSLVSSLHFMGISLGGNAATIGALYNDKNLVQGSRLYNSFTAICPVVDLKPTLDKLYSGQIVGRVFAAATVKQFRDGRDSLPHLNHLLTDDQLPRNRNQMSQYIAHLAVSSLESQSVQMSIPDWFKANNFMAYLQNVETPLLFWASQDDIVVDNGINTAAVAHNSYYSKNESIGVLNMRYGNHCAFNTSYGSQASAALLRSWVLRSSPEFVNQVKDRELNMSFPKLNISSNEMHIQQEFVFKPRSTTVDLRFKIYDRSSLRCRLQDAYKSTTSCHRHVTYALPINKLSELGARMPSSDAEAQAFAREFNTKIELIAKDGRSLTGTSQSEFLLKWRMF